MVGEQLRIRIAPDAKPFCVTTPRPHPHPLLPKIKAELDHMVATGVIKPVKEATEWCHPIVAEPKNNNPDDIRLCIDLRGLNKHIVREVYTSPTPHDIVATITRTRRKCSQMRTLSPAIGKSPFTPTTSM